MAASTDYDAPRQSVAEDDSLEELQARRAAPSSAVVDIDENDLADAYVLPGADQLDEELTLTVIPMQVDEFRCESCFLVRHRNQRARPGRDICADCA